MGREDPIEFYNYFIFIVCIFNISLIILLGRWGNKFNFLLLFTLIYD